MIATLIIIALAATVIVLIARDHYRELRAWDDYIAAEREDAVNEAAWDAAANVRSIREAPGFDRIADILAANEAARADWTTPDRWDR